MKKFGVVLGVAAVASLVGCKNPDYARRGSSSRDDVKETPAAVETGKPVAAVAAVKTCTCAPGTRHAAPCKCGAPDCRCVVVKPAPKPVAAPAEDEYTIYIVQNGDYLAKISKRYNVTIASIRKLNPSIKKDIIRVGQKLKLPGKVDVGVQRKPAVVKAAARKSAKAYAPYTGATREYVVKSGDTLGAIAYGNGINIRQLKELNSLKSDRLRIGQKLKVPASKAVAASEPKKAAAAPAEKKAEPAAVKAEAAPAPAPVETAPAAQQETVAPQPEAAPAESSEAPDAEESAAPAAEAPAAATETYVVQEGDDMTGVSIRWGVSAAAIRELNNLGDNDQLKPGQIIKLPAEAQQ